MNWRLATDQPLALVSSERGESASGNDLFANQTEELIASISKIEQKVEQSIYYVRETSTEYPNALRGLSSEDRPRFLFGVGNLQLLEATAVGICGSRHASDRAMSIARETVGLLCDHGVVITSGYAAGIDQMAHRTALEKGGSTIIVLPEGLSGFSIRKDLRDTWDWRRVLVLSQYALNTPWRSWNAMLRNRTIMALSGAMLVVEARATGGTFDAGKATLKYGRHLFAVQYAESSDGSAGNKILVAEGARPLNRNRSTGKPSIEPILNVLKSPP